MKKKMRVVFTVCLAATLCCFAFHGAAQAKIKLSYNNYFPPTHQNSILSEAFCKEIEKRTNGEVEITHYSGGTLLPAPKVFDGVVQGIADMGMSNLSYTPGRFPEMELCDLPSGYPSGWVATHSVNKFAKQYAPAEFKKAHILYFTGSGPNIIFTKPREVAKLEDMKGLTIRGTGRIADTVEALGAASRPIAITETYEAISRSVVDGVMAPMEVLKGFRLGEVAKYATNCWQVGNIYTFYVVMNKDKYNSLPPEIKKVFDEVSQEWIEKHAKAWNEIDIAGRALFEEKGGKVIELSAEETARWSEATKPVMDRYIKEMEGKGMSADESRSRIEFLKKTIAEYAVEQDKQGIKSPYSAK